MQSERKKILFIVPSLSGGGGQQVAATLCDTFAADEQLQLTLVVFDTSGTDFLCHSSIKIKKIDVQESGGPVYTLYKFGKVVLQLAQLIHRERPQAILSFMDYCNITSLLACRLSRSRSRVVLSVHTLFSAFLLGKGANIWGRLLEFLANRLYSRAGAVIAVSTGVANDLVNVFNLSSDKIHVIGNPFNFDKILSLSSSPVNEPIFQEKVPIILSVGRLSPEKGGVNLLKAFTLVRQQAEARLIFIGDGPEKSKLVNLSHELNIADDVVFLGYRDNPFSYMARSTIFVLPSLYEGFGNVLIESMACGLPVVATRCYEGIEDIIDEQKTGVLVEIEDKKGLADAIIYLLQNSSIRHEFAANAHEKVASFSNSRIALNYKSVLAINDQDAPDITYEDQR